MIGKTCFKQEKRDLIPEGSVVEKTTNGGGLSRVNGQINFSITDIEQLMWNAVLDTFQRAMVELLSTLDVYLMATRDKNRYEYKEIKEKSYVTMVGSINISRRYYWDRREKEWVFLLDRALGIGAREQISACLKELVVLWGTKGPSYRDARDRLKDLYGHQVLSHEKIRQILIQASDALKKTFDEKPSGARTADTLFIEADGFWTGVQQREDKKKRKRETHLVVVHEGWERRQGHGDKTDYRLKNPMYITAIAGSGEDVWDQTKIRLSQEYKNLKETKIIINGDLAPWIRTGVEYFRDALYQYDRFHLKRDVRRVLRETKKFIDPAFKQIDENNPEGLVEIVRKAAEETECLEKRFKVLEFEARLRKHKDALIDYRERLKMQGVEISPAWRGMGAAESNVDLFKLRTAKRGRAWSKKGLEAVLHTLGLLYEGLLHNSIRQLDLSLGEADTEELISMSASDVAKTVGRKALGIGQAGFPAIKRGTQGYAMLFRSILNLDPVG